MVRSSKRSSRQSARPIARALLHAVDPPDLIEREFLELWLGISRLRERVLGEGGAKRPPARKRKPSAGSRKAGGQAA